MNVQKNVHYIPTKKDMKKYLTIVIIMILSINSIMAQKLTTQNAIYDFGQILFRTPATAVFKIKNTSHKQIKIKEIYAPCGCTKAKISKKNIASNKEGTVEVVFEYYYLKKGKRNRLY